LKNKVGAPKKKYPKEKVGIRLHPFVVKRLKETPGYNALIQRLLCKWYKIDLKRCERGKK